MLYHERKRKNFRRIISLTIYTLMVVGVTFGIVNANVKKLGKQIVINKEQSQQDIKNLVQSLEEKENELQEERSQKEELSNKLEEYKKANIALEETIKKAALAGPKPQNYKEPPEVKESAVEEKKEYLGMWTGTFYSPTTAECGNNLGLTASGHPIVAGYSIAADTSKWPIGTQLYIEGLGNVQVMDTGSAIKGEKRFDFAVFDPRLANKLGKGKYNVYLIDKGDGEIKEIT